MTSGAGARAAQALAPPPASCAISVAGSGRSAAWISRSKRHRRRLVRIGGDADVGQPLEQQLPQAVERAPADRPGERPRRLALLDRLQRVAAAPRPWRG